MNTTTTSLMTDMTQAQWDAICEQTFDPRWDDNRTEAPGTPDDFEAAMEAADMDLMNANPTPALRCTEAEFASLVADHAAVCMTCGHLHYAVSDTPDCGLECEECDGQVFTVEVARLMGEVVFSGKSKSDLRGC